MNWVKYDSTHDFLGYVHWVSFQTRRLECTTNQRWCPSWQSFNRGCHQNHQIFRLWLAYSDQESSFLDGIVQSGTITVRSSMGKPFHDFVKILHKIKLVKFFRSSIFEKYLNLPNNKTRQFHMNFTYHLLRWRIVSEEKKALWVNYCGMLVCFGIKEFVFMTGLNCHSVANRNHPSQLILLIGIDNCFCWLKRASKRRI